jgi:drug/metabolite transporter (DMT)-like permease
MPTDRRDQPARPRPQVTVWVALLAVYLVWGSTYLAIRVAVETMPPFFMGSVRFVASGLLIAVACAAWDRSAIRWPTRREWLDLSIVGGFLLVGGNGLVSWGEQTVPSGIAALLVGMIPIWMAVVAWLAFHERQPRVVLVGVLVGLGGVAILAAPGTTVEGLSGPGLVALLLAAVFWAIGSVYAARHHSGIAPGLLTTGLEMVVGGVLLGVAGFVTGELGQVRAPSFDSLAATAYLIFVGSLVGYTAYGWLLRNAPLPLVSTYAYVNPVVAVALGTVLLGESIEPRTLVAGGVIVLAVAMIITARGRLSRGSEASPGTYPGSSGERPNAATRSVDFEPSG